MKKTILVAALALFSVAVSAKTADELRIYINPGHGSWTSNDRPMKVLRDVDGVLTVIDPATDGSSARPDTTAFYESNTNLRKGFALLDRLESYGLKFDRTKNQDAENLWELGAAKDLENNIVMSHVKAGPFPTNLEGQANYYNRSLSEIPQEVEYNNFDMFISIHSNAATDGGTVNYLVGFYRGTTGEGGDRVAGSRDMARACWPHLFGVEHQHWTARKSVDQGVEGDVSFMGSDAGSSVIPDAYGYYAVLKHHVPGFLFEGYFHTYQPSRHRAMNFDACRIEGYQFARGVADYFGLTKESTGEIYGVVRDMHEKFSHTYYVPQASTNDIYKPINGATVTLKKGGQVVKTVVTDNNYNGGFVFDNLEPGTYTIEFSHPDYKDADANQATTVEVKAATTVYPEIFLESLEYEAPTEVYYDYPDALEGEAAIAASDEYTFNQEYVDEAIAELDGLNVRRTIVRGDKAIVFALDGNNEPTVLVQDLTGKTVLRTLGTEGTSGSIMKLGDIAMTADGYLLGINAGEQAFGGAANVKIYKWNKNATDGLPEGNPEVMISMNHAGNWNNAEFGKTMAYSGTLADGYVLFANKSNASESVRIEYISVSDGEMIGYSHMNFNTVDFNVNGASVGLDSTLGDYEMTISPVAPDRFILTSEKCNPLEIVVNKASAGVPQIAGMLPDGLIEGTGFRSNFFKYAGHSFMVAPETVDGRNVGVALLDITKGMANATVITTTNTTLAAPATEGAQTLAWAKAPAGTASANGVLTVVRDALGAYESSYIDLYLTRGNAEVSKLSTKGISTPKRRAEYAYNLNMESDEETADYTFTFDVTGDVVDANIVLTETETGEKVIVPVGAVSKENGASVDFNATELTGTYKWAVEVQSRPVPEAGAVITPSRDYASGPNGGVVVINNPEYDTFGYTVVSHGRANGFDLYDRDNKFVGNYHKGAPFQTGNGSSPFRGDELHGKAVFADWSDQNSGYFILDPANMEAAPVNMCVGERDATGAFIYEGKVISGGSSCVGFQGPDDDIRMYTFEEDLKLVTPNGDNILVRYDLGSEESILTGPAWDFDRMYTAGLFANTNVGVFTTENGLFVSQVRGPGNNVKGCPGFIYIDNEGNQLFNSSTVEELNSVNSAVALSPDGKTLAVGTYTNIEIFSVEWTDNTPALTYLYDVPLSETEWAHFDFDPAGNLHAFLRNRGYRVYGLTNEAPKALTAGRAAQVVVGMQSSVENVTVAEAQADAAAVYYNLNGMRVDASKLGTGIYVKVQGTTATKVVIR